MHISFAGPQNHSTLALSNLRAAAAVNTQSSMIIYATFIIPSKLQAVFKREWEEVEGVTQCCERSKDLYKIVFRKNRKIYLLK